MRSRSLTRNTVGLLFLSWSIGSVASCSSNPDVTDSNGQIGTGSAGGEGGAHNGSGGSTGGFIDLPSAGTTGSGGDDGGDIDLDTLKIVYDGPGTLDVSSKPYPTVQLSATVSDRPITVGWSVDRGELGSISSSGLFTPSGTVGGVVTIRASLNGKVVEQQILIRVTKTQNGPSAGQSGQVATSVPQLTAGGGIGGVGGEGLGAKITKQATLDALSGAPVGDGSAQNLELLYPYDGTVFPRGMLAPLLMWRWSFGDAEAIKIELSTKSGSFSYSGSFGRPEILGTTMGKFVRHPIPQDVWDAATNSAGGTLADGSSDALTVKITLVNGDKAYGPLSHTFGIAPGKLTGVVYYNSYGTNLVQNFHDENAVTKNFGAAVLGIRSGETMPKVVSGPDSSDDTGCRACHTVSAKGSSLLVQGGGDDKKSWLNDLAGNESYLTGQDGIFGWAGLSPDSKFALTNAVNASKHNTTVTGGSPYSQLWDMTTTPPEVIADSGLPTNLKAAMPTFSPDGTEVSFAYLGGTGGGVPDSLPTDGSKLVAMDFDAATQKFSGFRVIATRAVDAAPPANYLLHGAGFPSFMPSGKAVVFQGEVRGAKDNESYIGTRDEARGELWWTSSTTENAVALNFLNGKDETGTSYLPTDSNPANKHGAGDGSFDDTTLNYEPTVNPVSTGGYVWVVFTSRRMYGNLAVGDPWRSDPRDYDIYDGDKITTKKLWVAALRTDTPVGQDPSYPAFYLPAQELIAGNARGFWVLDPCASDGASCESGDQCCGGYCQPNGTDGALVCSNTTTNVSCAKEQEKCDVAGDCCDSKSKCLNGFCARPAPPFPR